MAVLVKIIPIGVVNDLDIIRELRVISKLGLYEAKCACEQGILFNGISLHENLTLLWRHFASRHYTIKLEVTMDVVPPAQQALPQWMNLV